MNNKKGKSKILKPADPRRRKEPLPWQRPKSTSEDPRSARSLRAILESPSYRPAIEDLDFLDSDDARRVRLQLDYLKAGRALKQYGIKRTIDVFGSTRLVETAAAQRHVDKLSEAISASPDDKELQLKPRVATRILAKGHCYDIARQFSRLVANSGAGPADSQLIVMTGGGPGIMEAANRGAHDTGGKSKYPITCGAPAAFVSRCYVPAEVLNFLAITVLARNNLIARPHRQLFPARRSPGNSHVI